MNNAYCLMCRKPFRKNSFNHLYCGSLLKKTSCSYKRAQERWATRRLRDKSNPVVSKYMKEYNKKYRKKKGRKYFMDARRKWWDNLDDDGKKMAREKNKQWREDNPERIKELKRLSYIRCRKKKML